MNLETSARKTYARTRSGSPRGKFRCCLCVEKPVSIWFVSAHLPEEEYGLCYSCVLQYLPEDDLDALKACLQNVENPVIPWSTTSTKKPKPPDDLENWEDDLFD